MPTDTSLFFSLVVPQCESSESLQRYIENAVTLLEPLLPGRFELFFVTDPQSEVLPVAHTMTETIPQLKVIGSDLPPVTAGWEAARGNVLGFLDGDISKDDKILAQVVTTINDGADLAMAGLYGQQLKRGSQPTLGCFVIRRERLLSFRDSKTGQVILLEVLGSEGAQRVEAFADNHG